MDRAKAFKGRIVAGARTAIRSDFGAKAGWYTLVLIAERAIGVGQTIMLSRLLGIDDYGAYGVMFATLGLTNTLIGFQSGLAATVFVSRYLHSDPARVAGVIRSLTRYALVTGGAAVLCLAPFYEQLSVWLYHRQGYETATLLGILLIAGSIWSGIQDGFAQGFESFKFLAYVRLAVGIATLPLIYIASVRFGLPGALATILLASVAKLVVLVVHIRILRRKLGVPPVGPALPLRTLIMEFALPTVGLGVFSGAAQWWGILLLSRGHEGLAAVAIVNTGIQWRSPALLITSSLGAVAIPRFSRYHGDGKPGASAKLRRKVGLLSGALAAVSSLPLILVAPWIMLAYGPGFQTGLIPFGLILLSTVPTAVSNVYIQEMIGAAKMWRQFWIQSPYAVLLAAIFFFAVPAYGAMGYAAGLLIAAVALVCLTLASARLTAREHAAQDAFLAAGDKGPIDAHR